MPPEIPSALDRLDEVLARLRGRRLALFLDYDGALTPIVARPELAVLPDTTRDLLRRLAANATVSVVSGRALADVKALVGLEELVYAGNHGFEILDPERALSREIGGAFRDDVGRIRVVLREALAGIPRAWVENKTLSLSVHCRQVAEDRVADVEAIVDRALDGFPRLRKHCGKKVIEVRPRIDWDKGRAVLWLLEALELEGDDVLTVYVGDDVTDEDAFRALAGRGVGIVVAETPRLTAATLRLRDPGEVRTFLEALEGRLPARVR
jgi:trehalose-phosphatase